MIDKGQSAIEFVILVGAMLFFLAGFLLAIQYSISDKTDERRNVVLNEIAFTIQDELNLALESTDGYYRNFMIPLRVATLEYEINVSEGFVFLRTDDGRFATSLPVVNVTGNVFKGSNFVRKENGEIFLNQ